MADVIFKDDPSSRKVMRLLLLVEITAMIIVIGLILFGSYILALTVSFVTFIAFIAIVLWLYLRYQKLPLVKEKAHLQQRLLKAQNQIRTEVNHIQSARKKHASLLQEEKDEIQSTLKKSQEEYLANGLANTSLKHATVPGIGLKLKERLAGYGVVSAAQVGTGLSKIPGFAQAKQQALIEWRAGVIARLDSTKPISLTVEQFEYITNTYQALRQLNDKTEKNAQDNKRAAEYELNSVTPRLKQLGPITFRVYASRSLASRGMAAPLIAIVLIVAQLVSSVGAAASSLISSIPTAAQIETATLPTNTLAPTINNTATSTFTPTVADTPTQTFPPPATLTSEPTLTPLVILQASNTPQIPVSGGGSGDCDPSYPTVCIPPAPPDLDCKDIPYKRFEVLPPDPHDFDREGDGLGCES